MSETVQPVGTSAGALLKAARERQGVHLAVLAASLKVAPRKLELLEADRYDELPDPGFARALALKVCRALKTDAEPVLAHLPRQGAEVLDPVLRSLDKPFDQHGGGGGGMGGSGSRWPSLPLLAALVLAAAAGLLYVLPNGVWSALVQRGPRLVAGDAPAMAPAAAPKDRAPQGIAAGAAALAASHPEASETVVTQSVFVAPLDTSVASEGGLLSFSAASESWVEVRDASGQVLFSRTLAAGETVELEGVPPLRLTVGNAQGTKVSFRGQVVALELTPDNVARVELK